MQRQTNPKFDKMFSSNEKKVLVDIAKILGYVTSGSIRTDRGVDYNYSKIYKQILDKLRLLIEYEKRVKGEDYILPLGKNRVEQYADHDSDYFLLLEYVLRDYTNPVTGNKILADVPNRMQQLYNDISSFGVLSTASVVFPSAPSGQLKMAQPPTRPALLKKTSSDELIDLLEGDSDDEMMNYLKQNPSGGRVQSRRKKQKKNTTKRQNKKRKTLRKHRNRRRNKSR